MTTEGKAKREKLLAKIRALLAMTEENGCTEAEAMSAAAAADKLLQEYDLTYSDVDMENEVRGERYGCRRKAFVRPGCKTEHEVARWCFQTLLRYFNCRGYADNDETSVIFGTIEETKLMQDMIAMLMLAHDTEFAKFNKSSAANKSVNGRTLRRSFAIGFCTRVNSRINELRAARQAADAGHRTGRSLVVMKGQVVTEKFADYLRSQGIHLRKGSRTSGAGDIGAYQAGQAAGGRVDLGGGKVGSGTRMIGH